MRIFSQIVSWVLMPILMPIYALILVMYVPSEPLIISAGDSMFGFSDEIKLRIIYFYFLFTAFTPLLIYGFLIKLKIINSIQMEEKAERKIPLVILSVFCLLLYYVFRSINADLPKYIYGLCLSGAIILSIFTFVNRYIKVSLHATGAGILTGFVSAYIAEQSYFQLWVLIVVILVSGIVLTSRLYLEKHSPKELTIGFIFSLIVTFTLNYYYPIR